MTLIPDRSRKYKDPLSEKQADFTFALGVFVQVWADVEAELYRVLVHYAGLKDEAARAIFSGTRASGMVNYLNGIIHNSDLPQLRVDDLNYVLPQITAINTLRDRVVHFSYGSVITYDKDGNRVITDQPRVSRYGKHFVWVVGPHTLQSAISDLHLIHHHLNQHWHQKDPFRPWKLQGEPTRWLYKSQQPGNSNPKRGKNVRK
ncbi:MAG: hypothetical protein JWN94_2563 [Betaproteobacteria bacterium]|nr:hypothetical protein [Betaproteobacteria bacterium]